MLESEHMVGERACLLLFLCSLLPMPASLTAGIRVLAWSDRSEPADIYPHGINGAIAGLLKGQPEFEVRTASLSDPGQGLSEESLSKVDVLVWFGHERHRDVTQENADRVVLHIRERGMGFLPLHSAHYSKPFQAIMREIAASRGVKLEGTPGAWARVTDDGKPETIEILVPTHPIVEDVKPFVIPRTETYHNPFNVPTPDLKILEGRHEGDQQDGSDGLLWKFGKGRVFYFRPGHETYPIFFQIEIGMILRNAIRYLSPEAGQRT